MNKNLLSWSLILKKVWLPLLCLLLLIAGGPQLSAAAPPSITNSHDRVAIEPETDPEQGPPPGATLWRDINETAFRDLPDRQIIPTSYRLVQVDLPALDQLLGQAPLENGLTTQDVTKLILPLPDGRFGRFRIEESPIMEPGLAAQYPEIKTYMGWGLDDPTATARLDRTPAGFHGMILSTSDTVYIDPYRRGDNLRYISYYKRDYNNIWGKTRQEIPPVAGPRKPAGSQGIAANAVSANIRRTYRLAMAATGEYTAFHGGTKVAAQAAIVTTVNRVTGIYEREFLVRLTLINNTNIIYTNPNTDPYTNDDGGAMLTQNQSTLNSVIGSANYDIGHVFSTGGGGIAGLGVVCSTVKGEGVTGSSNPVGDAFDVDYVAHEMGHQFGANHTFNGVTGSCGGGNRNAATAYEPGSGSTIMAYAGICSPQDLQPHSDDYFHGASFDEIMAYINDPFGGASCGTTTNTGNAAPTVSAGPSYTIPKGTPFTLTGSASDANGDTLSYGWEQFNLGTSASGGLPNTDTDAVRPIFRSYNPVSSGVRTFPPLVDILAGANGNSGEWLPTRGRTMQFRLTVRDGKGGVANASTTIVVDGNSGPFLVTLPYTDDPWTELTSQAVLWNVANTTAPPVSCATVNIRLSTDDGATFAYTLASNTANDGAETVNVPAATGTFIPRVKVECTNNIFFDISNVYTDFQYLPIIRKNN